MDLDSLFTELQFKGIRSGGPGGQHVNKTASKVELTFDVKNSLALTDSEKRRLFQKLSSRLTSEGMLILQCGETRSQHRNKAIVLERLVELLHQGLKVAKPRKKTKPGKGAVEKRLQSKKLISLKKSSRKPPSME